MPLFLIKTTLTNQFIYHRYLGQGAVHVVWAEQVVAVSMGEGGKGEGQVDPQGSVGPELAKIPNLPCSARLLQVMNLHRFSKKTFQIPLAP